MASSSSKPTGVHYALVVFVLISIVCGLGWLLAYKGSNSISDLKRDRDAANSKAAEQKKLADDYYDGLKRIKDLLGTKYEDVGVDGSNPNTVLGAIALLQKNYGKGAADQTLSGMIVKQDAFLMNVATARNDLQTQLDTELKQFEQKLSEANAALAAEKAARDASDKGKVDADNIHKEEQKKKDDEIAEQKKALLTAQQEYDEYRESAEKQIKDRDQRIASLSVINKKLAGELDEKTRPSFEVPDGFIRWIDPVGRKVWISLGEADRLKPRTTFSVYRKTHSGVGRGTVKGQVGGEDIKGAIEVTRVLEANLSEARILDEDPYHPMAKGDPIYSPLWSPGRGEAFSIVGIMDLDGDGKDDRDLLKEAVATAGATIDNDVDEKGDLYLDGKKPDDLKPRITERTKFLVIGKIPEIADTPDPEQIAIIQKIQGLRKELEAQASERGVRVVSLSDFLTYIGYKSQRRLFVPGGDQPYNLKSGAASPAVSQPTGTSRRSNGSTSSDYPANKAKRPGSAGGAGAKIFRSGASNSK